MNSTKGYSDLGFAKIDTDRFKRRGFPEVVYCPGKNRQQLVNICREFIRKKQDLLLTKLNEETFLYLSRFISCLKYHSQARIGYIHLKKKETKKGLVALLTAGTADIKVAEEAALTLEVMGNRIERLYDVGVAGVHRLMHNLKILKKAKVIIVVAGMEGALASLVSGLVSCPVIAVPTSFGYGASFGGLAALLTMLNACSPGIAVVNIDNGFGAGYFASLINK